MKLSILTLFFACAAAPACWGVSDAARQEPIPDFGPEGPVGYDSSKETPVAIVSESPSDRSQTSDRGLWVRMALRQLDLDWQQQTAIKELFEEYANRGQELRLDLERMRETLKSARQSGGGESAVKRARVSLMNLTRQARTLQSDMLKAISEILSERQRQQFQQFQEARRKQTTRRAKT